MKKILFLAFALLVSGCVLAPAIDAFSNLGVTSRDRTNLLERDVKNFHSSLYWNRYEDAFAYLAEDNREKLINELRTKRDNERVVDNRLDFVSFSQDFYEAKVEMIIRYHHLSTNLVQERREAQLWRWQNNRWRLVSVA
jgi:hypothetical protein